jgi:anaerobic magnesium-protoporphyrin IX monomethyl ester cyclase
MKFRNVVLINPYPEGATGINRATVYPALGLAYLASVLRQNGIGVSILDANIRRLDHGGVIRAVRAANAGLAGIGLNIANARSGLLLSRRIKEAMDINICLGGPFVSSHTESVLRKGRADFAVVGEGERTLLELCRGIPPDTVKGLAWKAADGAVTVNGPADYIEDLDEIPFPAYDLLPPPGLYRSRTRRGPMAAMITSRGCPFHCTFCNHNIFGKRYRALSPGRVVSDMRSLIARFGIRQFDILDDNFLYDRVRAEKIFDLIAEKKLGILINLQNGIRVDSLDYPLVKKMKKAGVFKVGIGCESGNEHILKEMKKGLDREKVRQAVRWFKKEGIMTYAFFIIGFPMDTEKTIRDTIDFAVAAGTTMAAFSILIPFPGTEIYAFLKNNDMLRGDLEEGLTTGFFGSRLYHRCLHLDDTKILKLVSHAYRRFYFRPQKIAEIVQQVRSFGEARWLCNVAREALSGLFSSHQACAQETGADEEER